MSAASGSGGGGRDEGYERIGVREGKCDVEATLCSSGRAKGSIGGVIVVVDVIENVRLCRARGEEGGEKDKLGGNFVLVGVVTVESDHGDFIEMGESSSGVGGGRDGVIVVMFVVAEAIIDARDVPRLPVGVGDGREGIAFVGAEETDEVVDCWLRCLLKLRKDLDFCAE